MDRAPAAVELNGGFRISVPQARNFHIDSPNREPEPVKWVFLGIECLPNESPRRIITRDLEAIQGIRDICEWVLDFYRKEEEDV